MMTVRSFRLLAVLPKSPYQGPVSGCPSCAMAENVSVRTTARRKTKRADFIRILTPNLLAIVLWNKEFRIVDFGLAAEHQLRAVIVVLADVFKRIGVGSPPHGEHIRRPGCGIGARV